MDIQYGGNGSWYGALGVTDPALGYGTDYLVSWKTPSLAGLGSQRWTIRKAVTDTNVVTAKQLYDAVSGKNITDAGTAITALGWNLYGTEGRSGVLYPTAGWSMTASSVGGGTWIPAAAIVGSPVGGSLDIAMGSPWVAVICNVAPPTTVQYIRQRQSPRIIPAHRFKSDSLRQRQTFR